MSDAFKKSFNKTAKKKTPVKKSSSKCATKKRDECMEGLNRIESHLLREWDMPSNRSQSPMNCPASGCTHFAGHEGGHVNDDADLLPMPQGGVTAGFSNADRIADMPGPVDSMTQSGCECVGHCYGEDEECPCAEGCGVDCGCCCYDEAGPLGDDGDVPLSHFAR